MLLAGWLDSKQPKTGQIPQRMLLKVLTNGLETGSVQTNRAWSFCFTQRFVLCRSYPLLLFKLLLHRFWKTSLKLSGKCQCLRFCCAIYFHKTSLKCHYNRWGLGVNRASFGLGWNVTRQHTFSCYSYKFLCTVKLGQRHWKHKTTSNTARKSIILQKLIKNIYKRCKTRRKYQL